MALTGKGHFFRRGLWTYVAFLPLKTDNRPQVIHSVGNLQVEVRFMARNCSIV